MSKAWKIVVITIVATLFLLTPSYASAAVSAEDVPSERVIYVETLEKEQFITLVSGKEYILSYPANSEEWQISEIKVQVKNKGWFTIEKGIANNYLKVEACQAEQGRIALKIVCKTETITAIKVVLKNEQTEEMQEYIAGIAFAKKIENDNYDDLWAVVIPSNPGESPDDGAPGDQEQLITIDTSGWVFEGIQTTYDGTEYVALVKGLPEFVTPVYRDNTRTNAGSNKAYVTFEVPEGYAVPEGMETEIVIDKATIDGITLDRMWMATDMVNGTIEIKMPTSVAPTGVVNCTYEVNGEDVGSSYVITDTGVYAVSVNLSLQEGMEENYNLGTETAKALYLVKPDTLSGNPPPLFDLKLGDLSDSEGQKKVCVWIDYADDNFKANTAQWKIRYDPEVLEINTSLKDESFLARQNEYDGSDGSGIGYGMLLSGYYRDEAGLLTVVFDVKDSEATDIVVNITEVQAGDSNATVGEQTQYSNGYGIVLNQVSNLIEVTLPAKTPQEETSLAIEQEDVVTTSVEAEEVPVEEATSEPVAESTESTVIEPQIEQSEADE